MKINKFCDVNQKRFLQVYYLTGKNVTGHGGWSIVNENGAVCCTILGGMGLMAALVLCETLNDPTLSKKYDGLHDSRRICLNNYDDNKIGWNHDNVVILSTLYHQGVSRRNVLESLLPEQGKYIDDIMGTLIEEGWVYTSDQYLSGRPVLESGEYALTFMGKMKCEYLLNYTK